MQRILKSIIDFHEAETKVEDLQENFLTLQDSILMFPLEADRQIYLFIKSFYFDDHNTGDLPAIETIKDYFERENRKEILDRLEEVSQAKTYHKANFNHLLKTFILDQQQKQFVTVLKTASQINTSGLKLNQEVKKGTHDAARYLVEQSDQFISGHLGKPLKSDIRSTELKDKFIDRYFAIKNDPSLGVGRLTGLENIDSICRGLRKGELLLVAGFTGNMKTTLCLNYAYNTAVYFGYNVYYITLEMSLEQVQRIIYCLHADHPQFKNNPKYKEFYRKIDYRKLRDGLLAEDEEKYLQIVLNDFITNPRYGKFVLEKPSSALTVSDIQAKVEMEHKQHGVDLLFVDEVRLVQPSKRYTNTTEAWNEVIKDLKQLALKFNRGEGLPIISPFQTSRQGYMEAEKNGGEYKQNALSYANESERSADVIIFTYLDPKLRDANEIKIGNLKNRDNEIFKSFEARVLPATRKIENLVTD